MMTGKREQQQGGDDHDGDGGDGDADLNNSKVIARQYYNQESL